jgi:hypothetical protein
VPSSCATPCPPGTPFRKDGVKNYFYSDHAPLIAHIPIPDSKPYHAAECKTDLELKLVDQLAAYLLSYNTVTAKTFGGREGVGCRLQLPSDLIDEFNESNMTICSGAGHTALQYSEEAKAHIRQLGLEMHELSRQQRLGLWSVGSVAMESVTVEEVSNEEGVEPIVWPPSLPSGIAAKPSCASTLQDGWPVEGRSRKRVKAEEYIDLSSPSKQQGGRLKKASLPHELMFGGKDVIVIEDD